MAQDCLSEVPSESSLKLSKFHSQSDSTLSRDVSFSRLNAQAPEFIPARPSPRIDFKSQPLSLSSPPPPSPPPPGLVHAYHPPSVSPFHANLQTHMPIANHIIPVPTPHHHQPHSRLNHHHHHHHPYRIPGQYDPQQNQHYVGRGGFSEQELATQPFLQAQGETEHATSSKSKHSEETFTRLLNQVEYYFSDLNLATTDHLMRYISKDPDGYVPISVVASFKKIKSSISSHSQLANILRNSSTLVVGEDGNKVRRQNPLTEQDIDDLQSRIVIAENLPDDHCHQSLMRIFSSIGSVKSIRTCQPLISSGVASSITRSAKVDGMLYSNKLHAFVEYESVDLAEKAVAELNDEADWRSGLRVRLMLKPLSKSAQARGKKVNDGVNTSEEDYTSYQQQKEKHAEDPYQLWDGHPSGHTGEEHGERDSGQRKGRSRGRGKGRGRMQCHQNHAGTAPPGNSASNEHSGIAAARHPPGPRMPDGTRGFAFGRGKLLAVNIA